MKWIQGTKLSPDARREVLAAFIYRWTTGNTRRATAYGTCPHCGQPGGEASETRIECRQVHPTIPLVSDTEWLAAYQFAVVEDGSRLAQGQHGCRPFYGESADDSD